MPAEIQTPPQHLVAQLAAECQSASQMIHRAYEWGFRQAESALAHPEPAGDLPKGYIDPGHTDADRELLEVFYRATRSEGGTADEIYLRGIRAVLAQAHPEPARGPIDRSQLSDGYHTFAELYEHRHALMLAFMRAAPELCWFSRRHADGGLPFGSDEWFIVGAQLPTGAITYHLPAALWESAYATGAAELKQGKPWDGHTAQDVVERLTRWAIQPRGAQPEPAGEVTDEEILALKSWSGSHAYESDLLDICRAAIALALSRRAPVQPAEGEVAKKIEDALIVVSDGLCCFSAEAKHAQLKDAHSLLTEIAALLQHHQPAQPVQSATNQWTPTPPMARMQQPVPPVNPAEFVKAGIRYGYTAGHNDTVEACFGDPDSVAEDYAPEILSDLNAQVQPPQLVAVGDRHPDAIRMDALRDQSWDLRCFDMPTGEGDADVGWRVIQHHMAAPHERVVAQIYADDPRAAIDAAMNTPTTQPEAP